MKLNWLHTVTWLFFGMVIGGYVRFRILMALEDQAKDTARHIASRQWFVKDVCWLSKYVVMLVLYSEGADRQVVQLLFHVLHPNALKDIPKLKHLDVLTFSYQACPWQNNRRTQSSAYLMFRKVGNFSSLWQ